VTGDTAELRESVRGVERWKSRVYALLEDNTQPPGKPWYGNWSSVGRRKRLDGYEVDILARLRRPTETGRD
jgi:hypothetical protein